MLKKLHGRKLAVCLIGGAMYALFSAFGWQAEHGGVIWAGGALLVAALLVWPIAALLAVLLERGYTRSMRQENIPHGMGVRVHSGLLCADVWRGVPGSFAYDVPYQLRQVVTGAYSTHHPLLHTLALGGLLQLGRALGDINLGAALYTALQMALLAGCFALTCGSIARQSGARAAKRAAVFFALYPLNMVMAVNATKDVLFGGFFALTLALLNEIQEAVARAGAKIAVCGALAVMLRNNMAYAALAWLALLTIGLRKGEKSAALAMLLALAVGLFGNAALKRATRAENGDMSEMLSWPIQQLARARLYDEERLTDAEKEAIDELMPGEAWACYDPTISDPVKFEFDTQVFRADAKKYVGVWLSVGKKCAGTYLDATMALTYPFFYPYREYRVSGYYVQMGMSDAYDAGWCDFDPPESRSPFPRALASLSWRFGAKGAMQIPVVGWLFNMGVIVWTMLFFALREMYWGRWRRFGTALLPVLLWGTFLLGPVMAGRYIYPFVCALP
ncbi:MAG: DUF6020 family protein, partial [Christensenellales bacterium]